MSSRSIVVVGGLIASAIWALALIALRYNHKRIAFLFVLLMLTTCGITSWLAVP